ncbi:hypothetical protein [Luteipulveratus mongoliensis]|uniref:DUF1499 domain-containing protein n=1 Tax=Luteipulveratus mongoliensis TaxID=571913 RepID=A0A0K1JPC5_9MICO|nr:hypothetical protein [Luteipulveratus mongoliensis]AKU18438.1 hypothetical protein VV02_25600 [Luteipulveratus mongoliensis]
MARKRTRTVVAPVAAAAAHQATLDALVEVMGKPGSVHVMGDTITAHSKVSWRSWGEVVTVTIRPDHSGSRLVITSTSVLPTQVVDMGKHNKNLDSLLTVLGGRLGVPVHEVSRT